MNISLKTIPHAQQRYETCGDWVVHENGDLEILVSDLGNWKYEALIAFHELAEVLICREQGVTQAAVDEFDLAFEVGRANGLHKPEDEPGNDPDAPYRLAHFIAEALERILAVALLVDWKKYGEAVDALGVK